MPYSHKNQRIVKVIASVTEEQQEVICKSLDFLKNKNNRTNFQPCLSIRKVAKRFDMPNQRSGMPLRMVFLNALVH